MDFGVEPIDGAAIMKQSQGLIFNPLDAQQQGAQIDELRAQAQAEQANVAAAQQKAARFRQFQTAIHTYDGSPQSASRLIMQFPEYADQLKSGQDMQDDAKKQSDLTATGEIYSAALGGNWDLAKKLAHQRADAEKANGYSDPAYDAALGVLDQAADGDETQRKVVLNLLGTHLAAVTGPDHFATVYGALNDKGDKGFTLDAGATRYDSDGHVIAQSPYLKGADGTVYERDSAEGGGPASGGGAAAGGLQASVAHVLGNEGGYNPKDMNGSPTNFGINFSANKPELAKMGITAANFKDMTKDQAAQIYATKYWPQSGAEKLPANLQAPYFDVYVRSPALAKRALAQSGGDPAKFAQITNTTFQNMAANNPKAAPYAHAWATRDAGNAAIATGQASNAVPAADGAPAGYHVLTPGKQKEAPAGYQWSADGKSLAPIPGGPADDDVLDQPTVQFFAQQYLTTGQLPPMGMGKSATKTRQQIMKQAAKIAGADGLTGTDLAIQMAHYRAGVANVSNLEKQLGTVSGNEATFAQNAQQVAELARQLPSQTGSRILNTPIQQYLRQTNDPTVAAMDVAIKTAANEYARLVTASPSGAGTLSDSARMEYQGIIEGNFPLKQKLAALHQMSVDANNRTRSLRGTLQDAYKHLSDRAPELRGDGKAPAKTVVRTGHDKSGRKVIQYSDGSISYAN